MEFDPLCVRFPSFPYPYFEAEPENRFWKKFKKIHTKADGSCMFQALSIGYFDDKKYWKKHVKKNILAKLSTLSETALCTVYGLREKQEMLQKHAEVVHILQTDTAWGILDHLNLFERFFNTAIWTWSKDGNMFKVTRKPQINNNDTLPKFIHLLHEGGAYFLDNNHYSAILPNSNYVGKIRKHASVASYSIQEEDQGIDIISCGSDEISCGSDVEGVEEKGTNDPPLSTDMLLMHERKITEELENGNEAEISDDSFFHSQLSSGSSRPSNGAFQESLVQLDVISSLSTVLGKRGFCCDQKCLEIHVPSSGPFVLLSSIMSNPLDVILQCRQHTKTLSQKDRSDFVEVSYKNGLVREDGLDKKAKTHFKMFILLENGTRFPVCSKTFDFCYGITVSMSFRIRKRLKEEGISSLGKRKISQFITKVGKEDPESTILDDEGHRISAFIRIYCEARGEKMPNVHEIRISFPKRLVYEAYIVQKKDMFMKEKVDERKFYKIWNLQCADIRKSRWKGEFAICNDCKKSAQVDANPYASSELKKKNKIYICRHLRAVEKMRDGYALRRQKSIHYPSTFMSIIIDACDSNTTTLPNIKAMSKSEDKYREYLLKHKVMGVRVHALRKRDYLFMAPPFLGKGVGSNLTIEALSKTLLYEEALRLEQGA